MTSTPVSLNESLSGSWIELNSASQIPSPTMDDASSQHQLPLFPLNRSVYNIGLLPSRLERYLQETENASNSNNNDSRERDSRLLGNADPNPYEDDNNSGVFLASESDSESIDHIDAQAIIENLRKFHKKRHNSNNMPEVDERMTKSFDCSIDQLSDSLSFLSRASFQRDISQTSGSKAPQLQETTDWFWDWTAQPEYFSGKEWKINNPKQEYLINQRQFYYDTLNGNHADSKPYPADFMSLLFLTNILSIIIGAGLTYSILMRRPTV